MTRPIRHTSVPSGQFPSVVARNPYGRAMLAGRPNSSVPQPTLSLPAIHPMMEPRQAAVYRVNRPGRKRR